MKSSSLLRTTAITLDALDAVKRENKVDFSNYVNRVAGIKLDPDSVFDVQVKRLHEYKRQLLNALNIISIYLRLKDDPSLDMRPQSLSSAQRPPPAIILPRI